MTVPRFEYWPAATVPDAVQVMASPGPSMARGQETVTPWSSATETALRVSIPVLVTT